MRSRSATEVPPNFITSRDTRPPPRRRPSSDGGEAGQAIDRVASTTYLTTYQKRCRMDKDRDRLEDIVRPHVTVSDRIRALNAAGVARADIARFLGKRYQHVRNVLEGDAQGGGYTLGRADLSGVREGPQPFEREDSAPFVQGRANGMYPRVAGQAGPGLTPKERSQ